MSDSETNSEMSSDFAGTDTPHKPKKARKSAKILFLKRMRACSRFAMATVYFLLLVGMMALVIYISSIILQNTTNMAATEAFGFLVGWILTIVVLPAVLFLITKMCGMKIDAPITIPFTTIVLWKNLQIVWVAYSLFAFVFLITASTRLVPYIVFKQAYADSILVEETPLFRDSTAFSWTDSQLDRSSYAMQKTILQGGQVCIDCGDDCTECDSVGIYVKYCSARIHPKDDFNSTMSPGIAVCFWFPCRTPARWEPDTSPISEHDWDHNCEALPTKDDCEYECGPEFGEDGLTILNGVKIYGQKWNSNSQQASLFSPIGTIKYGIGLDKIHLLFATSAVPEIENLKNLTVLRNSKGVPLLLNWGDEPVRYFRNGLSLTVVVGIMAFLLFSPCSPVFSPYLFKGKKLKFAVHVVLFLVFWVPLLALLIVFIGRVIPG